MNFIRSDFKIYNVLIVLIILKRACLKTPKNIKLKLGRDEKEIS